MYNNNMRDLLLITPKSPQDEWCLDFDIVNGIPRFVPQERNTQDQRAAVAAYTFRGTIPGKPEVGIDWSALYEEDYNASLVTIDNEVKQAIQQYAAIPEGPNGMYVPVYETTSKGLNLSIYQG